MPKGQQKKKKRLSTGGKGRGRALVEARGGREGAPRKSQEKAQLKGRVLKRQAPGGRASQASRGVRRRRPTKLQRKKNYGRGLPGRRSGEKKPKCGASFCWVGVSHASLLPGFFIKCYSGPFAGDVAQTRKGGNLKKMPDRKF